MKIEEKMDLLFEAAGTLFERGLQGVRVNYIYGKYFYRPVKDDLLIVNPKNEPEYTAELIYPLGERKKQKKPMLRIQGIRGRVHIFYRKTSVVCKARTPCKKASFTFRNPFSASRKATVSGPPHW